MKSLLRIFSLLIVLFIFGVSCSEEPEEIDTPETEAQRPLNPNGDSELALLMRAMFAEAELIQQQIANDEPLTFTLDHDAILTAEPTDPPQVAKPEYHAYATAYLQAIKDLEAAEPEERLELYQDMVNNCMSCHRALCPGPMARISKLQ
jgi:hypothetical protein